MELSGLLVLLPELAANEHAVTHHIATQILSAGREGDVVRVTAVLERRTRRWASCRPRPVGDRL